MAYSALFCIAHRIYIHFNTIIHFQPTPPTCPPPPPTYPSHSTHPHTHPTPPTHMPTSSTHPSYKVEVHSSPLSATVNVHLPVGGSPQNITVENVHSLKPSVELREEKEHIWSNRLSPPAQGSTGSTQQTSTDTNDLAVRHLQ